MKLTHAAIVAVSALATMLLAPLAIAAGLHGHGVHAVQFHSHFRSARHHGNQSALLGYAGLYTVPPYTSNGSISETTAPAVVYVREMPRALSCQHSMEIKKVPSEDGGTREVTITRC